MTGYKKLALIAVASSGWILACILGTLVVLMGGRGHNDPEEAIALAIVIGGLLAVVPVTGIVTLVFSAFGDDWSTTAKALSANVHKPVSGLWQPWRRITFIILCAIQSIALPLAVLLVANDDDYIPFCIVFHAMLALSTIAVAKLVPLRNQYLSQCVITLHIVAIIVAVVCAAVEIETIIGSGVIVPLLGVACALVGTRPHTLRVAFGLSSVAFALVCFLVVVIAEWGPREAEMPVYVAMQAFSLVFVPVGLVALSQAINPSRVLDRSPAARQWQFGLRELIGLTIAVAIATGCAKFFGDEVRVAVAVGIGVLTGCGLVIVFVKCYYQLHLLPAKSTRSKPFPV